MEYTLIRSKRKSLCAQIAKNGAIVVRAPLRMPVYAIESFIQSHRERILVMQKEKLDQVNEKIVFTNEEIEELKAKAKSILPQKVACFAATMGVNYNSVKISYAKTRWGSCSGKNDISFSCHVMCLPEHLIDLIVVHELAHVKEKNHKAGFYKSLGEMVPMYKNYNKELKDWAVKLM